jgi:cobalamin synthase
MPTRKWFATQITALAGWFIAFITANFHWTTTIIIALVTIVSQAAIGWLVPNNQTPGGVPARTRAVRRRRRPHGESGLTAVGLIVGILLGALMYLFLMWLGLPWIIAVIVAVLICLVFAGAL